MIAALEALRALRSGDRAEAARRAAEGGDALDRALAAHLVGPRAAGVYDEAAGFAAFIGHGSNPELYRRTIAALARVHAAAAPRTVLELGPGDGRVVVGALGPATRRVDLVEPSAGLLAAATAALADGLRDVRAHGTTAQAFVAADRGEDRWDLAESTFALHAVPPPERREVLARLATRVGAIAIAEFDVPDLPDDDARLAHLAERYARGVAEYRDHPEAVSGFLMPVLAGQVEPGRARVTFEAPAGDWEAALRDAGFSEVTREPLLDYWWAPAVLLTARGA